MATKNIKTRTQQKIDTAANWDLAANSFKPLKGEICVFSDFDMIKIGDGTHYINELDFVSDYRSDISTLQTNVNKKYEKPSSGIPKTDLASGVQTSLNKADSALQSHQDISGKENTSNKVSAWSSTTTDSNYPSEKLVKSSLDGKANTSHTHTKSQITDFPTIPSKTSQLTNDSGYLTSHQDISDKQDKLTAGSNITISGNTISATNTTYSSGTGISLSGTTFSNSGVRGVSSGSTNGTISVNTGGTSAEVAVKGLGSAAYTDSTAYAAASHSHSYIPTSSKGAASGVAELDSSGKVPSAQLPSYVDDVLEYDKSSSFPATGETGKIYIAQDTNKTYRWSGSAYVVISETLALGTTSSTAYRGDYGASAYAHGVTNKGSAFASGLYKITTNAEGHVTAATAVAKEDITALGIPSSDTNTITTATTTGSGNAVTSVTASNGALTVTKGTTFLTSHQDISGKENISNKVTSINSSSSDSQYPSAKAVYTAIESFQGGTSLTEDDYLTFNEIAAIIGSDTIWDGTVE